MRAGLDWSAPAQALSAPVPTTSWLPLAEQALEQGDGVRAALLLDAHDAARSTEAEVALLFARVLQWRGRHRDACAALDRALAHHAEHVGLLIERAQLACGVSAWRDAHDCFQRAWRNTTASVPWVPAWLEVMIQLDLREPALAIACAHAERSPDDADAWFWLGYVHQLNRQDDAALDAYQRCAQRAPGHAMLHNNLAALHLELRDYGAAKTHLDEALKDDPDNVSAWTNLSMWWIKSGVPAAAHLAAERALALNPQYVLAWQGFSNACKELQSWDAATEAIERAHALEPNNDAHRWSLAMLQLMRGDYANGWINHEARWPGSPELRGAQPTWAAPRWDAQAVAGKTVLVWSEQGYGDVVQFVRFLPEFARRIRERGGAVAHSTFASLRALVARSLAGHLVRIEPQEQAIAPHDYQIPLGSLPMVLGVSLNDLSCYVPPYLEADAAQVARWRERCASAAPTLKVGLAWSGSRDHQRNPYRCVEPHALGAALAGIEGVTFYSLQREAGAAERGAWAAVGIDLVDNTAEFATFDETAAFVSQLDLVITVCTSVAHLAGALAVPTWLLLDVNPHWTWMTAREDSPWYPSMRLYRQPAFGQWSAVLSRLAGDLRARVATRCELVGRGSK
ncbi:hypothetical protein WJ07_12480 [Burkholderia vietnamiensis]|nr:hypothetical protein WJ07_12480 [Burkholderia vietnamiensis]